MDGRGRVYGNIFVERLWRTVKYEEVYLREYRTVGEARRSLTIYFDFYNAERLHQSLGYRIPSERSILELQRRLKRVSEMVNISQEKAGQEYTLFKPFFCPDYGEHLIAKYIDKYYWRLNSAR